MQTWTLRAEHAPVSPTGQEGRIKHTLLLKTTAKENRNLLITGKHTDTENESKQSIIYFLGEEKNSDRPICSYKTHPSV